MNEELIDDVLGQFVDIYKVEIESTNANVYGESSTMSVLYDSPKSLIVMATS